MGIRFACPNGHKLNVKEAFAGKRAICPECDAKVVVPEKSSEPRKTRHRDDAAPRSPSQSKEKAHAKSLAEVQSPAPVRHPEEPAPEAPPAKAEQWHIRVVSGEQYGPADTATMRQWITDGRVAADSWVWRSDWKDWKPGSEAIALVGENPVSTLASPTSTPAPAASTSEAVVKVGSTATKSAQPGTAEQRRKTLARRKRRNQQITIALVVLTLVLAVVLGVVLSQN